MLDTEGSLGVRTPPPPPSHDNYLPVRFSQIRRESFEILGTLNESTPVPASKVFSMHKSFWLQLLEESPGPQQGLWTVAFDTGIDYACSVVYDLCSYYLNTACHSAYSFDGQQERLNKYLFTAVTSLLLQLVVVV